MVPGPFHLLPMAAETEGGFAVFLNRLKCVDVLNYFAD
jgi:hypothetical protein